MPVNEFEKQVQQKMDELQLRPSAEVWEEVEKRIRKEKKRRRFILWFFLFGALSLGGAVWWIMDSNKKQTLAKSSLVQTNADKKVNEISADERNTTKNESAVEKQTVNRIENKKTDVQLTNSPVITKTGVAPDKKTVSATQIKNSYKREVDINTHVPVVSKKKNTNRSKPGLPDIIKNDQPLVIQKNESPDSVVTNEKIANVGIITTIKDSETADKNIVIYDQAGNKKETVSGIKDSLIAEEAAPVSKKDSSKARKNKWEFWATGMAGISGKSNGIFLNGQKSLAAASQISNPGTTVPFPSTVAEPANGFSWSIWAYAKRKLSARTGLSAGLNFSSYSTLQHTGAFVDSLRVFNSSLYTSSVQDFYRNGTTGSYKNHYYYLQLPFSFHWQINKGVKLPLVLQNGFSAGFLTGSNALIYNPGPNVFYRDNKLLYKTQFSYQSGLYAKLFHRSKNPMTAGILFNYHLSKLQKVNSNSSNHLASFGIQLGWLLKK